MSVSGLLNQTVTLYRRMLTPNGAGGFTEERVVVRQLRVRVSQPSAAERVMARTGVGPQQGAAMLAYPVYTTADEVVYRNDELEVDNGDVYRVEAAFQPSKPGTYLRMDCEYIQKQPTNPGSP